MRFGLQRRNLLSQLGNLLIPLGQLLLECDPLPFKIEAVILFHVVLLFKNEQVLALLIREVQVDPDGQLAGRLLA
jgi:hypothetical protein